MTDDPTASFGWIEGLPDALTAVVAQTAGEVLVALPADAVPASLRPLVSFDRRKLASATARRQLLRTVGRDSSFRAAVQRALLVEEATGALVAGFTRQDALARAEQAERRDDLAALVAALWAHRPEGWEVGIGAAAGLLSGRVAGRAAAADADALARRVEEQDAARLRADALRVRAEAKAVELARELRDERVARRGRDAAAEARAVTADARAAAATDRLADADARLARARETAAAHHDEIGRLRAALEQSQRALAAATRGGTVAVPASELARLAADAAALAAAAARLQPGDPDGPVVRDTRARAVPSPPAEGLPAEPLPPAADAARARSGARPRAVSPPPVRRVKPSLGGGMVADSADGVLAMLDRHVLLVVDGYNITHQAWPDATIGEQRIRLERALRQLRARTGAAIVCCYDGEGPTGPRPVSRDGVRFVFSRADQEADELVVEAVEEQPARVPVVVASSDGWVRRHAEAAGAVVVSAPTLVRALAAADRR